MAMFAYDPSPSENVPAAAVEQPGLTRTPAAYSG